MVTWEYRIELVHLNGSHLEDAETTLSMLGKAGWEVIALVPREPDSHEFLAVMKRPNAEE